MFKQYRRKQIAELRPIEQSDLEQFEQHKMLVAHKTSDNCIPVSISDADLKTGSPKIGDMVARNPKNHLDQWLIAKQYFEDNFESIQYCTQQRNNKMTKKKIEIYTQTNKGIKNGQQNEK